MKSLMSQTGNLWTLETSDQPGWMADRVPVGLGKKGSYREVEPSLINHSVTQRNARSPKILFYRYSIALNFKKPCNFLSPAHTHPKSGVPDCIYALTYTQAHAPTQAPTRA